MVCLELLNLFLGGRFGGYLGLLYSEFMLRIYEFVGLRSKKKTNEKNIEVHSEEAEKQGSRKAKKHGKEETQINRKQRSRTAENKEAGKGEKM